MKKYVIKVDVRGEKAYAIIERNKIILTKDKNKATQYDDVNEAFFKAGEVVMCSGMTGFHSTLETIDV